MRGGNLSGALVGVKTLISRDAKNPYFYELLGDLEYRYGHYDAAVDAYERALKLRANSPQIETALALVLVERGGVGDADRAAPGANLGLLAPDGPLELYRQHDGP